MSDIPLDQAQDQGQPPHARVRNWATTAGKVLVGIGVGCLLVPSLFELLSLIGGISPFKYQGF